MEDIIIRRILRVFGVSGREVALIMRRATQQGCPGLRLLSKDGEFAICFSGRGANRAQAQKEISRWEGWFREAFGTAAFGAEGQTLPQVTVDELVDKRKLAVAADPFTGQLLTKAFLHIPHSEAVFDFGNQSYRDPNVSGRMKAAPGLERDILQEAASRADTTRQLTGADYAVTFSHRRSGMVGFVLISTVRACWACPLPAELTEGSAINYLCEMLRRMAMGVKPMLGTIMFRAGHPGTKLGQCAIDPAIPSVDELQQEEQENKPDILPAAPTGDRPISRTQELRLSQERPQEKTLPKPKGSAIPLPDPLPEPDSAIPESPSRPNFPNAMETSIFSRNNSLLEELEQGAQPTLPPRREEVPNRLDQIADTIELELTSGNLQIPKEYTNTQIPRDYTNTQIPRKYTNTQTIHTPSLNELQRRLYGEGTEEVEEEPTATRNLKLDWAKGRQVGLRLLVVALIVAVIGLGLFLFNLIRNNIGPAPAPRSYGTASFDEAARTYLNKAMEKDDYVTAYLAWPGLSGVLLRDGGAESTSALSPNAAEYHSARFPVWAELSAPNTNHILHCGTELEAVSQLGLLDGARENAGFTFYTAGEISRYKLVGVFYLDTPDEFNLTGYQNLTNYRDYLDFVLGVKMRSLFSFPVNLGENDSFLTLLLDEGGKRLAIVGRRVRRNEDVNLATYEIVENRDVLLPRSMYSDGVLPDTAPIAAHWLDWYQAAVREETIQSTASGGALGALVDDLEKTTLAILANTDALMAKLTDLKADGTSTIESEIKTSGEGEMPTTEISVEQLLGSLTPVVTPTSTPAPTPTPEAPALEPGEEPGEETAETPAPTQTPQPEPPSGGSSPEGETINVNMNGSNVTMDLVECLAMVARNELGANAPDEAYKAQMVATHCWIISQGGYPSVLGQTPNDHLRSLAREVAHVLVTYNGQICFTPYFASASTGTASSASVWGGERPYLQPVDSPYDKQYASNWNTNGGSSSTALFSRDTVYQRIKDVLGLDLADIDPSKWFTILNANQYGWIGRGGIQIGQGDQSTTCSGTWFRENLLCRQSVSGSSLRSSCFTVEYQETEDGSGWFVFDVYGYGHGCGLSQWGAVGYASNGWNYSQILTHYYTGVTLMTY